MLVPKDGPLAVTQQLSHLVTAALAGCNAAVIGMGLLGLLPGPAEASQGLQNAGTTQLRCPLQIMQVALT